MREQTLNQLHAEMRACRRCLDAGYAVVPGAVCSGPDTAQVMVVGQAPGITETEIGRPFNGSAGRRLFQWLAQAGWDEETFRATQYLTAITKCYPGKNKSGRGDRAPSRAEQRLCAPFLERELALVQPAIVVPVGAMAVRRFLGPVKLRDVVGEVFRDPRNRWIVPLPHPSGANLWLNKPQNQERVAQALQHLKRVGSELGIC